MPFISRESQMVSMDYVFIESNGDGDPLSNTLWLETWDMPLPIPVMKAVSDGQELRLSIERDGWFEIGKTTFTLSDPTVQIKEVEIVDDRNAVLTCDRAVLAGKTVSFDMKNAFCWHSATAVIE